MTARSRFIKRPLRPLVEQLLANHGLSNARLALACRCSERRVARYRRAIADHGLTGTALAACDEGALQAVFKRARPKRVEARPNFERLAAELPGASGLVLWHHYRDGALAEGLSALSYSGFNRSRRVHAARLLALQTLGPWATRCRPSEPTRPTDPCWSTPLLGGVAAIVHAPSAAALLAPRRHTFDAIGAPHL